MAQTPKIKYSDDQLMALIEAIEVDGGALMVDDVCQGDTIEYRAQKTAKAVKVKTCNCGEHNIVVLPYEKQLTASGNAGQDFARLCLVCDSIGYWPKYKHIMSEWS